jgi:glyoxylase-like metal-dependent hydrolase (beta-lactamase superfamily II)
MGAILELAERAWSGGAIENHVHPLAFHGLEALAPGVWFAGAFANVTAFETAEGLVLVDASGPFHAGLVLAALRRVTAAPVRLVIVTHGHVDHIAGMAALDDEARAAGRPPPEVVAHRLVPARLERYALTHGLNARINQRQFGLPAPIFPTGLRAPDRTFDEALSLDVGGLRFELRHARGETDDAVWVHVPRLGVLCAGDFFIWAAPNCGNPQKVQRYPREWAAALGRMAETSASLLLPGHGPPIAGADRVRQALSETATLLESLVEQTLARMNAGATLDETLASVRVDEALLARPYLRPVYDDPEFIVRNLWRLYGGWWDGNPARLKPPRDAELARAVAELAGGAAVVARRARETADPRLAAALAELAWLAAPADPDTRETRAAIYDRRASEEPSLMARSIFAAAARDSRRP